MRPIQAPQAAASLDLLSIWSPVIPVNIRLTERGGGAAHKNFIGTKARTGFKGPFIALLWTLLLFLSPRHPNSHGQKTLKNLAVKHSPNGQRKPSEFKGKV